MQCRNGCPRQAFAKTGSPLCLMCLEYDQKARRLGRYGYVRFTDQLEIGSCWNWTGVLTKHGYGLFRTREGTTQVAHRASYEHYVGVIPNGLVLDHLCRNRRCVKPEHLEPVTTEENNERRGTPPMVAA